MAKKVAANPDYSVQLIIMTRMAEKLDVVSLVFLVAMFIAIVAVKTSDRVTLIYLAVIVIVTVKAVMLQPAYMVRMTVRRFGHYADLETIHFI